ncbi:glycosyltransferase family 4 protein [Jeotgalibacillus proteolyticus]|uniref:Undecaprenyl-phosphate alpha-N-acetylglucosaminyl 1-phosphate transferase n=1 Tax=Jeotgalibacillus proteolyticus TaxID=2082395 RepID=A0A2S5GBI4_9BACL|nr:MraY family glycosyltransferase [Jeotgalibacillus proteolyticus]PPA70274.1 undecaprenyl-phosphate alpha-N-acetylglucosaminyl 1-phosphate transferase [Jeotgalibacillus proteolyticus]
MTLEFALVLLLCLISSVLLTPVVKKFAVRVGATDAPNHRKVHNKVMPRLGGLAIFISFSIGIIIMRPAGEDTWPIMIGALIIVLTGALDDRFQLSPKAKLIGQITAALIAIIWGGVQVEFINLPFGGRLEFGIFSIPLTLLWIVGITNAINLIDGLDGLAAGVSTIAIFTISGMAIIMGDAYVAIFGLILVASTLGFLFYNFHPAKIFMGDTGALFLGFMISVLALLGFKNITVISLIIPVLILGVPISDTFFAIVRRILHKQPISAPDKSHLHHCLLNAGFTHRETVVIIYGIASMFSLSAFIFSQSTIWGAIVVIAVVLFSLEIIVESVGLLGKNYRPILNLVREKKS